MFFTSFKQLCEKVGKSPTAVGAEIDIAKTTISYWKHNQNVIPKQDVLLKIAEYFDVSVDYLLGNEPKSEDKELTEYLEFLKYRPEGKMLFSVAKGCTKEEIEQAVKIIEALRKPKDDA